MKHRNCLAKRPRNFCSRSRSLFRYVPLAARCAAAVGRSAVHRVPIWWVVPLILYRRPVVKYNSRYVILNHYYTTISGLKLGVKIKNRFHTGTAIYFLSTGVPISQVRPENAVPNAVAKLGFYYLVAYGEYMLLEIFSWEMSSNLQLGMMA